MFLAFSIGKRKISATNANVSANVSRTNNKILEQLERFYSRMN